MDTDTHNRFIVQGGPDIKLFSLLDKYPIQFDDNWTPFQKLLAVSELHAQEFDDYVEFDHMFNYYLDVPNKAGKSSCETVVEAHMQLNAYYQLACGLLLLAQGEKCGILLILLCVL